MAHAKNSTSSNITLTYQTKHRYKKKVYNINLPTPCFHSKRIRFDHRGLRFTPAGGREMPPSSGLRLTFVTGLPPSFSYSRPRFSPLSFPDWQWRALPSPNSCDHSAVIITFLFITYRCVLTVICFLSSSGRYVCIVRIIPAETWPSPGIGAYWQSYSSLLR